MVHFNSIIFYCFEYNEISLSPKLLVSVNVSDDFSVTAYVQSLRINQKHFQRLLDHGQLKSATVLVNIIAHCKAICSSDNSGGQTQLYLELAVSSLQQYLSIPSQTDLQDPSKLEPIKFIIEQLQLLQVKK